MTAGRPAPEHTDEDFPADPYPGAFPGWSYVHDDRSVWRLRHGGSGWRVAGRPVDRWLAQRGAPPLRERLVVLAYGSNRCPSKITWLRDELGLPGPAVLLRVRVRDLGAVWAAHLRVRDDQRPATLAHLPGNVEPHAVWLATREQLRVLDVCEGRGERYRLAWLRTGAITCTTTGRALTALSYVGAGPLRVPLLVGGRPVRCADLPQAAARTMTGVPAPGDGLDVREVTGDPEPPAGR